LYLLLVQISIYIIYFFSNFDQGRFIPIRGSILLWKKPWGFWAYLILVPGNPEHLIFARNGVSIPTSLSHRRRRIMDLLDLYKNVYKARAFEIAQATLWRQGLISGELHLGTGEEAIAAGVVAHIMPGDGVAVDHRATPVLSLLGVDMGLMLKEMLGREDGLCRGRGGHMHLFSREHVAASSGIVGSAPPLAAGFAVAAKRLRPGRVGVAFFGEGAANQGMVMEAQNLAAAWSLPLIFICKDNGWAITTPSSSVTGGDLVRRAEAFGLASHRADGLDVMAVWKAAGQAFEEARRGKRPQFLLMTCSRLDGHFLGDPLLRIARRPVKEGLEVFRKTTRAAFARSGGGFAGRAAGMAAILKTLNAARPDLYDSHEDPVTRCRQALKKQEDLVVRAEEEIDRLVSEAVEKALTPEGE
jgi:TPP-dependent pyruvate/acetoin dehydrogenase alpha subunit